MPCRRAQRSLGLQELNAWSMWPDLHGGVVDLLEDDKLKFTFRLADDELDLVESYDTNVMGRFTCHNPKCSSRGWPSKQIAITIRLYRNNEYNARIWHQRCRSCNQLSKPMLDQTYAERVAYRLKKWSGVPLEPPEYSRMDVNRPHRKDLCEGCKNGRCNYSAQSEKQKLN
ncbi:zinc-binding domain-containing protein [Xylaria arbuscula]|nr:zinc-binding domain-containing protein [Xylaria arbuscula]